jgi:hypothetical protein
MRQTAVSVIVLCACAVGAQTPAGQNPIAAGQKMLFSMVKNNIIRSAEKMPEENFGFKPTPEVRSFGQLIGHVLIRSKCSARRLGKPVRPASRSRDDEGRPGAGGEGRVRVLRPVRLTDAGCRCGIRAIKRR